MNEKYPRSLHSQISLGTTSDDRFIPDGYVKVFSDKKKVLTEKLDGQNTCFNRYGVFARSHVAPTRHEWDKPIWDRYELIKRDLGDIDLFAESMYAIHSIEYTKLESFLYVFGVRDKDVWLSWDEVKFYAEMFDLPTVPEIPITTPLKYTDKVDENVLLKTWLTQNLGMPWTDYTNTHGGLGGIDPLTQKPSCEGFVVRLASEYKTNNNLLPVAENEMDGLFKLVRKNHVQTQDKHWSKNWKPAKLINTDKYKWFNFAHTLNK